MSSTLQRQFDLFRCPLPLAGEGFLLSPLAVEPDPVHDIDARVVRWVLHRRMLSGSQTQGIGFIERFLPHGSREVGKPTKRRDSIPRLMMRRDDFLVSAWAGEDADPRQIPVESGRRQWDERLGRELGRGWRQDGATIEILDDIVNESLGVVGEGVGDSSLVAGGLEGDITGTAVS